MKAVFNSNCLVTISKVQSLFDDHEIDYHVAGYNTSAMFGHSIDMFPVSFLVDDDQYWDAARILRMENFKPSCDK